MITLRGTWKGTLRGTFEELGGQLGWDNSWGLLWEGILGSTSGDQFGGHIMGLQFCGGLYMGPIVSSIQDFLN